MVVVLVLPCHDGGKPFSVHHLLFREDTIRSTFNIVAIQCRVASWLDDKVKRPLLLPRRHASPSSHQIDLNFTRGMYLIALSSLSSRASLGNQAGGCQPLPQPEVSLVGCTCPIGWGEL